MRQIFKRGVATLLSCVALSCGMVFAQAYPSRPITIVVPYGPGSGNDLIAREIAQKLTGILNTTVVVENKAGATGNIATDYVAQQKPDGYTIFLTSTSGIINQVSNSAVKTDLSKDFESIGFAAGLPYVVAVPPAVAAKSLTELVALAKANPGKLNYGSGNGTSILTTAQFAQESKLNMVHVPYKGDAPATADLIAGRIQVLLATPGNALQMVQEGRLRVLMALLPSRSPLAPETPTADELGIKGMTIVPWAGLFGPAGLPKDVVDRVAKAMKEVSARKDVRDQLGKIAFELQSSTPKEMGDFNKSQLDIWKKTADSINLERN
jgi:tripartite-type tricarboxylate transporter receptor subunit TctC